MIWFTPAAFLLLASVTARAAEPLDTILAAFDAETQQPIEAARLFFVRDGVADLYVIERVSPGRLRMVMNPRQGGPEVIVVDGRQWLRSSKGWKISPVANSPIVPSMTALIRGGLTEVVEQASISGMRMFSGRMVWTNGSSNEGRLEIGIDAAGLPRLLRFDGACAGKPCRFHQRMDFGGPVKIDPP